MGTNTGLGIGIGIPFKNNALGGDRPYLPPKLKAKLIGVWDNYGKKNTDADRNIIKNKIPNAGGDLEILNAAYEGMSGYNGYPVIFGINKTWRYEAPSGGSSYIYTINDNKYNFTQIYVVNAWAYSYIKQNGELTDYNKDVTSFKIKVTGLEPDKFLIKYNYLSSTDATVTSNIVIRSDGIYELPKSFANDGSLIDNYGWVGFGFAKRSTDIPNTITGVNVTIEVLPEYEGAFVTDGVNDMIISQKTLQEMGITDEVTVVSMIHQIDLNSTYTIATTNYIENSNSREHVRSDVYNYGKTGIYGYSASLINNTKSDIKNILGDKADYYVKSTNSLQTIFDAKFSVVGRINQLTEASQVAWYWTFIAKGLLTTDEINQVIAYYNLDKYVKPDIYYNVKKQGLTNDNHAQFGDKLIDYSGNSRDLQLFNIGWNPGSGIGKYVTNFGIWSKDAESNISYNSYSFTVNGSLKRTWLIWYVTKLPSFKIKVSGINSNGYVDYGYYDNGSLKNFRLDKDGIHTLPPSGASSNGYGFKVNDTSLDWTGLVIEQIPDFAGALCFDGVDDYGQVTGMPIYKDYTVVADREFLGSKSGSIVSKSHILSNGAFIFETFADKSATTSFGSNTLVDISDFKKISYQSKYIYNGNPIQVGTGVDGDSMCLGVIRENDSRFSKFALWSFLLFPYTLSEFLLERQLKKHKLGTLYPNMIEFRPVIKSNVELVNKPTFVIRGTYTLLNTGDYIPREARLLVTVTMNNLGDELTKFSVNGREITISSSAYNPVTGKYEFPFAIDDKSPQKISITIDEYIRFEDIMQPYPVKFRFTDVDSGQVYDWGSKIKVGSTIKILSNVDIGNYLSGIYTITGYKYNGNIYSYNELKELTFLITNQPLEFASRKTYKLGGSEPKVILYPERLKLSNDTYKRLGYIPDLTGNGNHGVFNNLAFTEESGVNEDGSVHLDGVDDYISIPTLSKGGKQVLMKVNWSTLNGFIYDQRPASGDKTFGIYTQGDVIAYSQHNNGNTYIDGIINNNIIGSNLSKITHNIVATCDVDNSITPSIGKRSYSNSYFAQMALYAFMLFDEISTDEGIKDLNDIVGIVSKVELPPYYWDTYGKTNTDADRDEIVNLASDEVSIQYPTDFTDTSVWEDMGAVTSSTILTLTTWAMGGDTGIGNTIKAKVATPAMKVKFITDGNGYLDYMYSGYNTLELPRDAGEYEVELPASTIVEDWGARFSGSGNGSFTIELLGNEVRLGTLKVINSAYNEDSGYKNNGIALDGVDDSLVNTDIPVFTDFTVIAKRIFLGNQPNNVVFLFKGDKVYSQGIGNALLMEYRYDNGTYANYIFSNANSITLNEDDISYVTPTDYNGQQMNYIVNTDNKGLVIGRSNAVYWKGVFYKLMLYPKTIDILSINMLKNLFERDEIIDLNNPIFIKDE